MKEKPSLRQLARLLRSITMAHAECSRAGPVISRACDQLEMLAGIEEKNKRIHELETALITMAVIANDKRNT